MSDDRAWDLSPMVGGASPDRIKDMIDALVADVDKKYSIYAEQIDSMSAPEIANMLEDVAAIELRVRDLLGYCSMKYSADTTDKESNQLNNWANEAESKIGANGTILEIKLGQALLKDRELLESEELAEFKHFLERLVAQAPYRLSEAEERLVQQKDLYGIVTMQQLQQAWVSQQTFEVEIDGEKKTVTLPTLSSMRMSPKRELRELASRTLYKRYADHKLLHGTALHAVCADHVAMSKKRGHPSPMTQSLLSQDVDEATVEALLSSIENTADKFQDFLKIKAKHLGYDRLLGYDVIAPWTSESSWEFTWPDARKIVIDSFTSFDTELGNVVTSMFDDRRIDSANRVGKANTAYCAGWPSAKKSYVFINYNQNLNSLYTLAHENGHAAQGHLIYHAQHPMNYGASACMAETGSIFGELLLTEKILGMSETDEQRLETLSHVLNSFYYTVYYVGVRALCEKSLYQAIEDGEYLNADLATDLWQKAKDRVFGDAVDWTEYMEYEIFRIPHFFFPNYRFYNYSYSFAQMLVFGVYEAYQKGEEDFEERFKKLLATGNTMSPRDQIAEFGYDLTSPEFWEMGPRQADRLLDELKKLV